MSNEAFCCLIHNLPLPGSLKSGREFVVLKDIVLNSGSFENSMKMML
jgi:hypothetical protein